MKQLYKYKKLINENFITYTGQCQLSKQLKWVFIVIIAGWN